MGLGLALGLVTSHSWGYGFGVGGRVGDVPFLGLGFGGRVGDVPFFRFGLGLVTLVSHLGFWVQQLSRVMILFWLQIFDKKHEMNNMTKSTKP